MDKNMLEDIVQILHSKLNVSDFQAYSKEESKFKEQIVKKVEDVSQDLDNLISYLKSQFQNLNNVILNLDNVKEDKKNVEPIRQSLKSKVDQDNFNSLLNQTKFDLNDHLNETKIQVSNMFSNYEEITNSKIEGEVTSLNKNFEKIWREFKEQSDNNSKIKTEIDNINKYLSEQTRNITIICQENNEKFTKLFKTLEEKIDLTKHKEFEENLQKYYSESLNGKASFSDLDNIYQNFQKYLNEKVSEIQNTLKTNSENSNQKFQELTSNKVNYKELENILNMKTEPIFSSLNNKVEQKELNEIQNSIDKISHDLIDLVDKKSYDKNKIDIQKSITEINEILNTKVSSNEMEDLLFNKVDSKDLNNYLEKIYSNLEGKVNNDKFNTLSDNQGLMLNNFSLCNSQGRWIWKSGKLKNYCMIPWEEQEININPNNFFWEKDKSALMIAKSGTYQIWICIFGLKTGSGVKLMINGECYASQYLDGNNSSFNDTSMANAGRSNTIPTVTKFDRKGKESLASMNNLTNGDKFLFLNTFINTNEKCRICVEIENNCEGTYGILSIIKI